MTEARGGVDRDLVPHVEQGHAVWRADLGAWKILCRGRPRERLREGAAPAPPAQVAIARLRQIHSDRIAEARPGACGEGDALVVSRPALAATVVSADCVPVVVAAGHVAAAIHAGWRGIAAEIVPKTVERLATGLDAPLRAWIGPAIGPCCYEVGDDVARLVASVSAPSVRIRSAAPHAPRLDLRRAVHEQLLAQGVDVDGDVALCTSCHPEWLWSYRRDGPGGGRIETFVWRE